MLEQLVFQTVTAQRLIEPGDRVVAAVSGGADSMALLHVLYALRQTLQIELSCAHFHHGLRGAEADRDAAFVRCQCQALQIPFLSGRGDTPALATADGLSIEEAARTLRYAFFDGLPADKICTAHTADDNAETMLLHLLRGTGLRGLAGIPPVRGRYVRPLLSVSRTQIEAYLLEHGIPHVEDATNRADDCVRNRLRHHVIPLLLAENPSFLQTAARTASILRQEEAYLSRCAATAADRCRSRDGWRTEALLALDPVLRRRVLLEILRDLQLENPSQAHLEALEALLLSASPSACATLPAGWVARRENDLLLLRQTAQPAKCPETLLKIPGDTVLSEIGAVLRANVTENSNFSQKNLHTFALRYDMITANAWSVRARQSGDTLRLPGGHRRLKRLLIDRKIPALQRDALPVVLCAGEVACVPGVAVSEDFRPVPGQPVLELTLLPENTRLDPGPGGEKGESH